MPTRKRKRPSSCSSVVVRVPAKKRHAVVAMVHALGGSARKAPKKSKKKAKRRVRRRAGRCS